MRHKAKATEISKELSQLRRIGLDIIVGNILLSEAKMIDLRRHWREHLKRKTATEARDETI